ncbi:hypothetical protein [Actinoplanes palleronii]|uniref:Uncharacterized protein n=1 Tax=Actinoplanes palleronii TaxID=113570 RepID=A0ABQ4BQB5_9ACTN|nr:hypothetical protein [Actinoplanes palleronii]GIE72869.1 hypothetical protein Apa02nite_089770 [Actinoplanes palleronii]
MPPEARRDAHRFSWQLWQSAVKGTPAARPFWMFVDRHRANPARYDLERARADYPHRGQPRLTATRVFNTLPHRPFGLPTSHLEALQLGADASSHLGWLSAVAESALVNLLSRAQPRGRRPPVPGQVERLVQAAPLVACLRSRSASGASSWRPSGSANFTARP